MNPKFLSTHTVFIFFPSTDSIDADFGIVPISEFSIPLLTGPSVKLKTVCQGVLYRRIPRLTVIQPAPHSAEARGISLCATLWLSLMPVRSFTVTGISPKARFIPVMILPSFPAESNNAEPLPAEGMLVS